jgi:hypothetical protein
MDRDDLIRRVRQYADRKGMVLGEQLRDAIHLTEVPAPLREHKRYRTTSQTAIAQTIDAAMVSAVHRLPATYHAAGL